MGSTWAWKDVRVIHWTQGDVVKKEESEPPPGLNESWGKNSTTDMTQPPDPQILTPVPKKVRTRYKRKPKNLAAIPEDNTL
jgi:hypothetical protein